MGDDQYHVVGGPNHVETWATARLPFEPKGWQLEYRTALRDALRALVAGDGALRCVYTSPIATRCDVENVLLYNVGSSAFAALHTTCVTLERVVGRPPPSPVVLAEPAAHHHRYAVDEDGSWPAWPTIASWDEVPLRVPLTVEGAWFGLPASSFTTGLVASHLALDVTVHRSPGSFPSVLAMMKALVDGMLSALHAHDGSHLDIITDRLAERLPARASEIAARLQNPVGAVLGQRRLLWPYRRFVQWNPADDLIAHLRLRSTIARSWAVSGRLSTPTLLPTR